MANSGPHTNGSQFFILYKSANHLNFKHTVFCGVVGGMMTPTAMEKVPVDDNDRPLEEIKITDVTIFVNPYTDPDEEDEKEKAKEEEAAGDKDSVDFSSRGLEFVVIIRLVVMENGSELISFQDKVGSWYSNPGALPTEYGKTASTGAWGNT